MNTKPPRVVPLFASERRSRIDWSVLPGVEPGAPTWSDIGASSDGVSAVREFTSVFEADTTDALMHRAVELALRVVGLTRAGVYLYDAPADLMLGTWGTDLDGRIIDEHHAMFTLGTGGARGFARATSGQGYWTLIQDCPIIDLRDCDTRVEGHGWVVSTPIQFAGKPLGMFFNDSGLSGVPVEAARQNNMAVLCSIIGAALHARGHSNQFLSLPGSTARHPALRKAVHLLRRDPSLSGEHMASLLGLSLSRLARLFKSEIGMSLVDYRNQLRLGRFLTLCESNPENLLEAALSCGFGSYSQFHRVFREQLNQTPSEYLAERGAQRDSAASDFNAE